PCSVPGHLLQPIPASGFRVLVPSSFRDVWGHTGGRNQRQIKIFLKTVIF
ncbi:unnamed protein product, partial [Staurois parvus]